MCWIGAAFVGRPGPGDTTAVPRTPCASHVACLLHPTTGRTAGVVNALAALAPGARARGRSPWPSAPPPDLPSQLRPVTRAQVQRCRLGRNNFDPQTAVDHLPVHIGKCVSPAGLMAVCDSLVSTRFPPMAGAWMLCAPRTLSCTALLDCRHITRAQRQAPPAALTCPLPLWPPTPESPPLTFPSPLVGLGPGLPSAFLTLDLRCAAQQKRPWFRAAVPEAIMAGR